MDNSLVYKQDVQRLVCRLNGCVGTNRNFENCEKRCPDFKAIDELLIVQQHRRAGRWIFEKGDGETCVDGHICSACGSSYHTKVPYWSEFKFCPNGGAFMEG